MIPVSKLIFKLFLFQKRGVLHYLILLGFSTIFISLQAQEKDTLSRVNPQFTALNSQFYKINDNISYAYKKPEFFDFINKIPNDFVAMGSMFIQKENLMLFGVSLGATAALVPIDQSIIIKSRAIGAEIGFQESHDYSGPIKMFPKNINAAIYRVGNGFTTILVGGGLLIFGLTKNNYRAVHTSSELLEGIIASGLLVQPFKRLTGRESPDIAEKNGNIGGNWKFAPSFSAYQSHTPNYDAMPSGHITTLMTSLIILSENYKEIKWIKPVGFGLMGLMGLEMLQSKVHWASDYPIAIFMGYVIGKSIARSRIKEVKNTELVNSKKFNPKFRYSFTSNQNYTIAGVSVVF